MMGMRRANSPLKNFHKQEVLIWGAAITVLAAAAVCGSSSSSLSSAAAAAVTAGAETAAAITAAATTAAAEADTLGAGREVLHAPLIFTLNGKTRSYQLAKESCNFDGIGV